MWGGVGLYGRPRGGVWPCSSKCQQDEQDAGDHKGPPSPSSAALAPTDADGLFLG